MKRTGLTLGICSIALSFLLNPVFGQDLALWYTKPSQKWTDALPIGNGRIGGMVYGGITHDQVQFNEETLWTDGPRNYNKKGAYVHLSEIRSLLAQGRQSDAEKLAAQYAMGQLSDSGNKQEWQDKIKAGFGLKGQPWTFGFDDSSWKEMDAPNHDGWEELGFEGLDGALWFRKSFELPANWSGKDLTLDLGKIRDQDFTYVNGALVGSTPDNTSGRKYIIPASALRKGKNIIAIQVLNFSDKGGLVGYKDTRHPMQVFPVGAEAEGLSINGKWKYFIQDNNPPPVGHYQASYQPFGDVFLDFPASHAKATNYKRELDLRTAVSKTSYTLNGIRYTREYLVSQPDQVMAIHLKAGKPGALSFSAVLNSNHKNSQVTALDAKSLLLAVKVKDGQMRGNAILRVENKGGKLSVGGGKLHVSGATEVTLYLSAATNYKNFRDVSADENALSRKYLTLLGKKSFEQVRDAHIREYQGYFNTFSVAFGGPDRSTVPTDKRIEEFAHTADPSLAALYIQYGRYLLISSSRPGTGPANLQGIWNDLLTPPWGSKYTTNINLEMNYWPAELLNLSATTGPLFKMIDELRVAGAETAKEYYNAPGWVLHHNTDQWRGTAPINNSNHGIWVSGGAWLCQHLWEHYLFTQDKTFLRERAYPVMKDAARFFNAFLVKDPKTGWLISTPSNSPEQGGLVAGPTMDHQIIRSLFANVVAAAGILGEDAAFADTLSEKYKQIAPNQIGKYGQLQEWLEDKDDTTNKHRHVSHLWGVYPGHEISWSNTPDLMKAARQSLIYRGDEATGWSLGWKINLWARFLDGDHSYNMVKMLIKPAVGGSGSYVNLFDAHPPFQIDGNFGGAAGIAEMLLQSQTDGINILPALPAALAEGSVRGICARGGFELSFSWKDGKLQRLEVLSKAGAECSLTYAGRTHSFKTVKGAKYVFNGNLQKQ